MTGLLIAAAVLPGWMIGSGGRWSRKRTFLILVPPHNTDSVQRLTSQIKARQPKARVAYISVVPTPEQVHRQGGLVWRAASAAAPNSSFVLPATKGWLESAASLAPAGFVPPTAGIFPCPTVVIPYDDSAFWNSTGAGQSISILKAAATFRANGANLILVDVTRDSPGAGHFDVTLDGSDVAGSAPSGSQSLKWLSTRATVELTGCPYFASDRKYTLQAWIDRRAGTGKTALAELLDRGASGQASNPQIRGEESSAPVGSSLESLMVVGKHPEDSRRTTLQLSSLSGPTGSDVLLKPGFHRLDVQLSFSAVPSTSSAPGVNSAFPMTYRASRYFEVTDRKLVVVERQVPGGFTRESWVHRPTADSSRRPSASEMLTALIQGNDPTTNRLPLGNAGRVLFSRVVAFREADLLQPLAAGATDRREDFKLAISDAAMVFLLEPTWAGVAGLDTTLQEYVANGGVVVTAVPPTPPDSVTAAAIPFWLPAVADTVRTGTAVPAGARHPVDVVTEPRVYFLPDGSRPASKFFSATGEVACAGAIAQANVINSVYASLKVTTRGGAPIVNPIALPASPTDDMTVSASATTVGVFKVGGGFGLVVPPLLSRTDTSLEGISSQYASMGTSADLLPSFPATRLWSLTAKSRAKLYPTALKTLAAGTSPIAGVDSSELDAPYELQNHYPRTTIVIFALQVDQPQSPPAWNNAGGQTWFTAGARYGTNDVQETIDPTLISAADTSLLVVPIKLNPKLTATYNKHSAQQWVQFENAVAAWGAQVLKDERGAEVCLDLSGDDTLATKTSVESVVKALSKSLVSRAESSAGHLDTYDSGRAIDLRVGQRLPPRMWRRLMDVSAANHPDPAAVLTAPNQPSRWPAIVWTPVRDGTAHVLAYSPVAYDMWWPDHGPQFGPITEPTPPEPDGWGMQRLFDPIALLARARANGPTIEAIRPASDESSVAIDCFMPAGTPMFDVPRLFDTNDPSNPKPSGVVVVSDVDVLQRRITFVITGAGPLNPLEGSFDLRWGSADVSTFHRALFLRVLAPSGVQANAYDALRRTAELSGGSAIAENDFSSALSTDFSVRRVAAFLLLALVAGLLSPWMRRYRPFWQRRRMYVERTVDTADDDVSLEAAFETSGMSLGKPAAQRPAGRVLQIRPMRPGDAAVAARRSDWGYFVDEIARAFGSPPMPRVIETPHLEALSIITLLDTHPGAFARDNGSYHDRERAMARIAILNAQYALHQGGVHRVMSAQTADLTDPLDPTPVDDTRSRVALLKTEASRSSGDRRVPDITSSEAVVFITNAGTDVDEFIPVLAKSCIESRCKLAIVFLTHPTQLEEIGLMWFPGSPETTAGLSDRSDLTSKDIERYLALRAETLAAAAAVADTRTCKIRTDQPVSEIVTILGEQVWSNP